MHFRKVKKQQNEVLMNESIDSDKDGNQLTIADIYRDPSNLEDMTELLIDTQNLYNYINEELEPRERQIMCKRYGLLRDKKGKVSVQTEMTQQEVADSLGISRSYVSRIEKKCLGKLKERFRDEKSFSAEE